MDSPPGNPDYIPDRVQNRDSTGDLVSVIIPYYRSPGTIRRAIDSVLIQDVAVEIILVDDGSNDDVEQVIADYAGRGIEITCVRNAQNLGCAGARNIGLGHASAGFVAFLDSDDYWYAGKLKAQLQCMQAQELDFCATFYDPIAFTKGARYDYHSLLANNFIATSTVLIRAETIRRYEFRQFRYVEDYVLWLQLFRDQCRFAMVEQPLTYVEKSTGGESANKFKVLQARYRILRSRESLGRLAAGRYILMYVYTGLLKYRKLLFS